MSRYFLSCPRCDKSTTLRNMTGNDPQSVYWCKQCNRYWQLLFGTKLERVLRAYDPAVGKVSAMIDAAVPNDWEGEPMVFGIEPEVWRQIQGSPGLVGIKQLVEGGDRVVLLDEKGKPADELVLQGGELGRVKLWQPGT